MAARWRKGRVQRRHGLREVCNALRWIVRPGAPWRMLPHDFRRWDAVYQQTQHWIGAGCIADLVQDWRAVLALHLTPANASDRAQVAALVAEVQAVTGQTVEVAVVDQGYIGDQTAADAAAHGIHLEVGTLPEATRGFVLLPRRSVVERSFVWATCFRRVAKDDERRPDTVVELPFVAFACLMLHRLVTVAAQSP